MRRRHILAPALVALSLAACDALMVEPSPAGPDLRFALAPSGAVGASFGDLRPAMNRVRAVRFSFLHDGAARDTTVSAVLAGEALSARVTLRPDEAAGWLEIRAELLSEADEPMFRGHALARPVDIVPGVSLEVTPVASQLVISPAPQFTALGDTIVLAAAAYFATEQVIPGAPIVWESDRPDVAEVLAGNRLVSRGNGVATLTVSSLGFTVDQVAVVRQSPVVFTGLAPTDTTLAVGASYQLRPFGTDQNGYSLLPGARIDWSSINARVRVDSLGVVTAQSAGAAQVDGTVSTTQHQALITVTP